MFRKAPKRDTLDLFENTSGELCLFNWKTPTYRALWLQNKNTAVDHELVPKFGVASRLNPKTSLTIKILWLGTTYNCIRRNANEPFAAEVILEIGGFFGTVLRARDQHLTEQNTWSPIAFPVEGDENKTALYLTLYQNHVFQKEQSKLTLDLVKIIELPIIPIGYTTLQFYLSKEDIMVTFSAIIFHLDRLFSMYLWRLHPRHPLPQRDLCKFHISTCGCSSL